jgi:hypothetical protein
LERARAELMVSVRRLSERIWQHMRKRTSTVHIAIINMWVGKPSWKHKLTPYEVIAAKEPQAMIGVEGEDARMDSRYVINLSNYELSWLVLPPGSISCLISYPHNLLWKPFYISRMIKDDREKTKPERSVFAEKDLTDKVDSYWGRAWRANWFNTCMYLNDHRD